MGRDEVDERDSSREAELEALIRDDEDDDAVGEDDGISRLQRAFSGGVGAGGRTAGAPLLKGGNIRNLARIKVSWWNPHKAVYEYLGYVPPDATEETLIALGKRGGKYSLQGVTADDKPIGQSANSIHNISEDNEEVQKFASKVASPEAVKMGVFQDPVIPMISFMEQRSKELSIKEREAMKAAADITAASTKGTVDFMAAAAERERGTAAELMGMQHRMSNDAMQYHAKLAERVLENEKASMAQNAKVQETSSNMIVGVIQAQSAATMNTIQGQNASVMQFMMQMQAAETARIEARAASEREEHKRREEREDRRREEERLREERRREEDSRRFEREMKDRQEALEREDKRRQEHMALVLTLTKQQSEAKDPLGAFSGLLLAVKPVMDTLGVDIKDVIAKAMGGGEGGLTETLVVQGAGVLQEMIKAWAAAQAANAAAINGALLTQQDMEEEGEEEEEDGEAEAEVPAPAPPQIEEKPRMKKEKAKIAPVNQFTKEMQAKGREGIRELAHIFNETLNEDVWASNFMAWGSAPANAEKIACAEVIFRQISVERALFQSGMKQDRIDRAIAWIQKVQQQLPNLMKGIPLHDPNRPTDVPVEEKVAEPEKVPVGEVK